MTITAEQRERRRLGVGSSDVPVLAGGDIGAISDLYLDKTEGISIDAGPAADMGTYLEPTVLDWFSETSGYKLVRETQYLERAHPDGVCLCNHDALVDGFPFGVEAKTVGIVGPSPYRHEWDADAGVVPTRVLLQVQHQMYVSDLEKVFVAALIGGLGFVCIEVERDDRIIQGVKRLVNWFWDRHVLPKRPPEGYCPSIEAIRLVERVHGKTVELDVPHPIMEYICARENRKRAEEEENARLAQLLDRMGDADRAVCAGWEFKYAQENAGSRFDHKRLLKDYPAIDPGPYTTKTTRRVPRVKAPQILIERILT